MTDPTVRAILDVIGRGSRFLLVSHLRPDGDAVGSVLGLGLSLEAAGKSVAMVLEDGVPVNFRQLTGADRIDGRSEGPFDAVFVLDCSDLMRAGAALDEYHQPHINIDHHPTNDGFAAINMVIESACSTTEMIYDVLRAGDIPIPPEAAEALLTGLVTDTIGFQTPNISAKAIRTAADLMELGPDLSRLYRTALIEKSFEAYRYWGAGLMSLRRENGLVWASLTLDDRRQAGYGGRDDADLVNQLSAIKGSMVRIIFIELSDSEVKVSWRSQPGYDVSGVAGSFGGGGHRTAAGATVAGALEDVRRRVVEATRELMGAAGELAESPIR
ncbi:MAG TPA: DHH family phosphoesterase [Anaerolineales bacterium]|nr:DHH family phosphoesterase [Anaerolineales bacterium]